eukprot:4068330-Lingulodinium_polyedra.AAC.1
MSGQARICLNPCEFVFCMWTPNVLYICLFAQADAGTELRAVARRQLGLNREGGGSCQPVAGKASRAVDGGDVGGARA